MMYIVVDETELDLKSLVMIIDTSVGHEIRDNIEDDVPICVGMY